jgi:TetR/AcrR family transcriptional regulator, transcriptional repressor for nem operon
MGRTSDSRKRLIEAGHELIWNTSYGSVTIEAICDRAHVQKGTFYHFFESKADLIVAAIDAWWDVRKSLVAECFAPTVPPLLRITRYIDYAVQGQLQSLADNGRILGCPMFTLASEICTQDEQIRSRLRKILDLGPYHFGNAIRDAQALGEVPAGDCARKARLLWAFYEGTLTRARIDNDPELIRHLSSDAMTLLGAKPAFVSLDTALKIA